jgi:serine/threonine-protein kinase RsbW
MRLTMMVSLPKQPSSIGEARHILAVLLSLTAADDQARDHLVVLLTEACANVVKHGDSGATIDLQVVIESGTCVLEVGNRGHLPDARGLVGTFPDPAQTNGRGLPLIAGLSERAEFVPTTPGYVLLRMTLHLQANTRMRAVEPSGP